MKAQTQIFEIMMAVIVVMIFAGVTATIERSSIMSAERSLSEKILAASIPMLCWSFEDSRTTHHSLVEFVVPAVMVGEPVSYIPTGSVSSSFLVSSFMKGYFGKGGYMSKQYRGKTGCRIFVPDPRSGNVTEVWLFA